MQVQQVCARVSSANVSVRVPSSSSHASFSATPGRQAERLLLPHTTGEDSVSAEVRVVERQVFFTQAGMVGTFLFCKSQPAGKGTSHILSGR